MGGQDFRMGPYGLLLPMCILFPLHCLLFAYNISMAFETAELALKVLPMASLFFATIPCMVVWAFIQDFMPAWGRPAAIAVHVVMCFVNPIYHLGGMLIFITQYYSLFSSYGAPLTLAGSF